MKCVAIKGVKEFEIKEIEEPVSQNGEVVIDVKKTGICGSDIHYWDCFLCFLGKKLRMGKWGKKR